MEAPTCSSCSLRSCTKAPLLWRQREGCWRLQKLSQTQAPPSTLLPRDPAVSSSRSSPARGGHSLGQDITPGKDETPVLGAVTTGHIPHCCSCQWDGIPFPLVRWRSRTFRGTRETHVPAVGAREGQAVKEPNPPQSWISAPHSASQVSHLHITAGETEAWQGGPVPAWPQQGAPSIPLGIWGSGSVHPCDVPVWM